MNRTDECEYDDKKQKSRTQKLKEKLSALEERLRELESEPREVSPFTNSSASSSSSSRPSPGNTPGPLDSSAFGVGALYLPPETPHLDLSSLGGLDTLFESSSWSGAGSSSGSSSSGSLYPPAFAGDDIGSDALTNSLFNMEDFDPDQTTVHPFLEMSPFTSFGSTANSFPYMPRWDPKDPLPFENRKIL